MTAGGWLFMIVSLVVVWTVTIWSYWKVLTSPPPGDGGPKPPPANL